MRKILSVTMLLLVVMLSGCNQEKTQVETYLKERQASNDAMKATANEMEKSMAGLQQEIAGGNFDAEKVKGKITEFQDKMKAEKAKVEGLSVPEKCKTLHETTVKQYQVAIDVLGKTPAMIDIAKKMSDGAAKMKADPKQQKAVMADLQAAQGEMGKIQQEVMALAQEGQSLEKTAKEEEKKLQDEFKLTPAATSSPAAAGGSTPAAPATPAKP